MVSWINRLYGPKFVDRQTGICSPSLLQLLYFINTSKTVSHIQISWEQSIQFFSCGTNPFQHLVAENIITQQIKTENMLTTSLHWGQSLQVHESEEGGKEKKALGNCVKHFVLIVVHVTRLQIDLLLRCFPRYLKLGEAVDFTLADRLTVCCTLYAIIVY